MFAQLARLCFVVLCTEGRCAAAPPSSNAMVVVRTADTTVVAACDALAQGRAWRATRTLEPVLRDAARRTPDVVLLAAAAAAQWAGWSEVFALLGNQPWIDSHQAGRARVLLARASLETGADSLARVHASAAVAATGNERERALRRVLLARAFDRLRMRDSARAAYEVAGRGLPEIADWLRLRSAALQRSARERTKVYEGLTLPAAVARAPRVEAQTLEALVGDVRAAARVWRAIGEEVQSLRLRAGVARTAAQRAAVRNALIAILQRSPGSEDAREAATVLESRFTRLSATEALVVARSMVATGTIGRAAAHYRRGLVSGRATQRDRLAYARVLRRLDRNREAIGQLQGIMASSPLAGEAALLRARSLLNLNRNREARTLLRAIPKRYPRDTAAAAGALYVLADLATDERRDGAARAALRELARRYPTSEHAAPARFRAALIAFVQRRYALAAAEFDSVEVVNARSGEVPAATYWAGRAWARAGDSTRAATRWNQLLARDPLSYYAAQSARRLGEAPWAPSAVADAFPAMPAVDSVFARADLLASLGMDFEARLEYDQAMRDAPASTARLLATGAAFRARGETTRAIQLGWKAVARGQLDARSYRLIYPILMGDALVTEARLRRVDPALVAAIIRQESSFNPRATSGSGARGLMQVMPAVGRSIARAMGFPYWSPELLYEPDVNLQLGITHLRALLGGRHDVRALAAYNAGDGRVRRWSRKPGAEDPEVFVELIPYPETRDYVRIVLRNRDLYRALYGFDPKGER